MQHSHITYTQHVYSVYIIQYGNTNFCEIDSCLDLFDVNVLCFRNVIYIFEQAIENNKLLQ